MSDFDGGSVADDSFREHGLDGDRTQYGPRRRLPAGVGIIRRPGPGRRYLFHVDDQGGVEVIVPKAELDRGIEDRLRRSGNTRRSGPPADDPDAGSEKEQGVAGAAADPERAALAEAKRLDREQLVAAALDHAEMVKIAIDVRAMPGPPDAVVNELPDIVDAARGGEGLGGPDGDGQTWQCWPNHLLTCQEYPEWGPGGPVHPLKDFVVPRIDGDAGNGVVIAVIDTGGRVRDHEMLKPKSSSRGELDDEDLDRNVDYRLDLVAGHGTFIAGIIRQVAPGAEIVIRSAANPNGTAEDGLVAGSLLTLLTEKRVDIVNLSMGGYLHEDEGGGLPLTTSALKRLRDKWPQLVVVAAAGNDHRSDPFFPAALPNVIGVGALDARGEPAKFSNFGDWVDAWAIGVNLRSAWVGPDLRVAGGGGNGTEGATWSGTSFATPMVAGALAAAMSPGSAHPGLFG